MTGRIKDVRLTYDALGFPMSSDRMEAGQMSVLIRGMEMPESCSVCPCNYDNVCAVDYKYPTFNEWRSKRPDWCPLVELPAEHGRLIDADALTVSNGWVAEAENYRTHITFIYEYDIVNAPTIIEAEGVDG